MRRREVLAGLGGAAAAAAPLAALAQPDRVRRIALLMSYREGDAEGRQREAAFRDSLRESGWSDGRNLRIDVRWLGGDPARAKAQVKEVVDQSPDVIVVNGTPGLAAVRDATNAIATVFVIVTNPVGAGFVPSMPRPGGNITGFSSFEPEIGGKWLEALTEVAPSVRRVGVLIDPDLLGFADLWLAIERLAPAFGVQAMALQARDAAGIDTGIERLARQENGGLIVLPTPLNSIQRDRIVALAAQHRLPAVYPFGFHARSGGLIAYGFDAVDLFKRAAPYVARVLNGEKPGDLPVQAPVKFELVINMRTAKALALPPTLLARADEVIE
jgi:putative tryptophan/tyrosine transport system substrate-binding protein